MLGYLFAASPLLLLVLPKALDWLQDAVNRDGGFQRDAERFLGETVGRGMSYRDAMNEWDIRIAFAKLRRIASDRVAAGPIENWFEILETAKAEIVNELARSRPDLVKPLVEMIEASHHGDILYSQESAKVSALYKNIRRHRAHEDRHAALRVV